MRVISIRIHENDLEKVKLKAAIDNKSLSGYIRRLIFMDVTESKHLNLNLTKKLVKVNKDLMDNPMFSDTIKKVLKEGLIKRRTKIDEVLKQYG